MMKGWLFVGPLAGLLLAGCSREAEESTVVRETLPCVKDAVRAIFRVERAVGDDPAARPRFVALDVEGLTAAAFQAKLTAFVHPERTHLWMPGEKSWLLVEHPTTNGVSLAAAMEALAEDASCVVSVPEVFASYVGTLDEVLPAFAAKLEGEVVPEWFVTKEVPSLGWLTTEGEIDEDILKLTLAEIRSMQVVRRLILEGNMAARQATDKKSEEAATEKWARAWLRNPNDPLLRERCAFLRRNAEGFLALDRVLQAMKCYETLVLINPKDAVAVREFGNCLQRVGRKDMAKEVLRHAEELERHAP